MTSLLTPSYALTLGTQVWTQQVLRLQVSLQTAPLMDRLTAALPVAAPVKASLGDPVELKLNGGEKEEQVFTGTIVAMHRSLEEILITALNAGGVLAGYRPSATYEQASASTVIKNLAQDAGVDVSEVADGVSLTFYVADPNRTALDHVARVSAWGGAIARITPENKLESVVINASQAEAGLRYGRELLSLEHRQVPAAIQSFTVTGEGGAGDASVPEARIPTLDFFAGNRPSGPSGTHRWDWQPALRTVAAAATAGAAVQRQYNSSREQGWFLAFLQPHLRSGTVLEIQDLPSGLPQGPLVAHQVQHILDRTGGFSRVHFTKGGDSFDPLALLGSLIGGLKGLL
jgi:hypothetical protein